MTRPDQLKPREDSVPGTNFAGFTVGRKLDPLRFTITPAIVEEYIAAVDAERAIYRLDGRPIAPPNVLLPYMTAILYRTYPPIQGIIMIEIDFHFRHPIWADEDTEIDVSGAITGKFEKKGRLYVDWQAQYCRRDGILISTMTNRFNVPS